jgi:DNA polymerase-3 subunit delta
MVAYKNAPLPRLIKSLHPECRAALVYGPDAGLVAQRAAALARHFAGGDASQTEIVRLDERNLAEESGRLEVELRTFSMFAARKVVRVAAGLRLDVPGLKSLLASPLAASLVIEAGALRPDSAVRKLFEAHKTAAAFACYADERNLTALIEEEIEQAGLSIDAETRAHLMTRLGADQALSRMEIAKLVLYVAGNGSITHEDIDAVVGDSSEIALERFVYLVSGSDGANALRELRRLEAAGTDTSSALSALARHFTQLHRVAAAAGDQELEQAVKSLRPRPHFKREPAFIAHCRKWGAGRLLAALSQIQDAIRTSRHSPELASVFTERLLLSLTRTKLPTRQFGLHSTHCMEKP